MTMTCSQCGVSHEGYQCPAGADRQAGAPVGVGLPAGGLHVPTPRPVLSDGAQAPSGATHAPGYGKAKFVGDAAPVGGIPISRMFNSLCYVIAGIALLVISAQPSFPGGGSTALAIVIGLAAIAYGGKILLTRTSYWVSSWVYLLAFGSVAAMFGFLSQ